MELGEDQLPDVFGQGGDILRRYAQECSGGLRRMIRHRYEGGSQGLMGGTSKGVDGRTFQRQQHPRLGVETNVHEVRPFEGYYFLRWLAHVDEEPVIVWIVMDRRPERLNPLWQVGV